MQSISRTFVIAALSATSFLVSADRALAQQSGGSTQGPLVLQPVSSGFLFAPDIKVSQIAGRTETLAGAYGGWVNDGRLLIGGGGQWLATGSHNLSLGYGGLVVGWLGPSTHAVTMSVRGLVGFGGTTQYVSATSLPSVPVYPTPRDPHYHPPVYTPYGTVGFYEGVFVAEPEVDADVALASSAHLLVGVGYRAVNSFHYYNYYGYYGYGGPSYSQLSGPTASFSLQFRFW
jgi:hypothetical protein